LELLSNVHLVEGVTSNTYLIVEPDGLTVIDTGMMGSAAKIARYIRGLGRDPRDVRRILLTHQHVDHVGGAAELAALTGAEVLAHPLDTPAIEGHGARALPNNAAIRLVFRVAVLPRLRPVQVTGHLRGGETLPVLASEGGLRVVELPGHTLGQIGFYLPARKLFFPGDAYRHAGERIVPPPALFNHDTPLALRTFAALRGKLEIEASLPGHGRPMLKGAGERLAAAVAALG
jgi:glyoxylase-like metal-dependent hydrolase (beta-lactamase superfamily II)